MKNSFVSFLEDVETAENVVGECFINMKRTLRLDLRNRIGLSSYVTFLSINFLVISDSKGFFGFITFGTPLLFIREVSTFILDYIHTIPAKFRI